MPIRSEWSNSKQDKYGVIKWIAHLNIAEITYVDKT